MMSKKNKVGVGWIVFHLALGLLTGGLWWLALGLWWMRSVIIELRRR